MDRRDNIAFFKNTLNIIKNIKAPKTYIYQFNDFMDIIKNSSFVDFGLKEYNCEDITVENDDCIEVAKKYSINSKVTMLNMASRSHRGGGVLNGARAQEETLCRRSDLYNSLLKVNYPTPEFCSIISENIYFFKDNNGEQYKDPFTCNVVSCAAYRIDNKNKLNDLYINNTKKKILTMLLSAASHNTDVLILSALGCGAYNNPPNIMADIFYDILITNNYKRFFKKIIFAIIDDHNSKSGNFAPFNEKFKKNDNILLI
jgi:uncharacterized protein (TIGR02452 family)